MTERSFEAAPTWIDEMRAMDPAAEAAPGVTIADMLALHDRLDAPAGAVLRPRLTVGGAEGVSLDLYARADAGERRPGVLFVHGGGWAGGCRSMHSRHCAALAERGMVAATLDYRLVPAVRWPHQLEDVAAALQWMRAHAGEIGLDAGRLAVAGGSAGGHLAAMAALSQPRSGDGGAVSAAVLWYPVTDLEAVLRHPDGPQMVEGLLGGLDPRALRAASPLHCVHGAAPPVLILTGEVDALTTADDMRAFRARLEAAGVDARLHVYPGRDHAFDLFPRDWDDSFQRMCAFLDEVLAPPVPAR